MIVAPEVASARPYLLRAIYEWCGDQGLTPYVTVFVDELVQVPKEFVRDGTITLNIGVDATNGLLIGNESIEFKARFSGIPRQIFIPMTHVIAIYARENGQGMTFPILHPFTDKESKGGKQTLLDMPGTDEVTDKDKKAPARPALTRIK